ncbi:hypothetical protein AB0H57_26300 [Micromonospora sp. NPDC050686]|uniref:TubC N-terminal docking domain-related protein n=1 Tax=Micromonospora sp. NPDC050686 TaxID=3154631 RepID=UPI0033C04A40
MLAITDFLEELRLAGVQLWLQDGRLRYRSAGGLDAARLAASIGRWHPLTIGGDQRLHGPDE